MTEPSLVTLYDIQPGNEACLFLQPQSPHGASSDSDAENRTLLRLLTHFNLDLRTV